MKPVIFSVVIILIVLFTYVYGFCAWSKCSFSDDMAVWGQVGDYFGGTLNPILSFISITLLIKSLRLQNNANSILISDLKNQKKSENLKTFENIFFKMIDLQRASFGCFKIDVVCSDGKLSLAADDAVVFVENKIEELIKGNYDALEIRGFLTDIEKNDQMFEVVRSFYLLLKIISDRLSDDNGFCQNDRLAYMEMCINFTNFSNLRLICIAMEYLDFYSIKYIKNNVDFMSAAEKVDLFKLSD